LLWAKTSLEAFDPLEDHSFRCCRQQVKRSNDYDFLTEPLQQCSSPYERDARPLTTRRSRR